MTTINAPARGTALGPPSPRRRRQPQHRNGPGGEASPTDTASVLVEIGQGKGALVLYLDDSFRDREVEISRVGSVERVHTGVHARDTPAARVLAAVFGSIPAGEYVVWRDQRTPAGVVVVADGEATQEWLPGTTAEAAVSD